MARSLQRGQIAPAVVCQYEGGMEVVDGFKRTGGAARRPGCWPRWASLSVRVLDGDDERAVKAAFIVRVEPCRPARLQELEEAWLVQALVREDGLTQVEAAELLGRHKSWACRRLALLSGWRPRPKKTCVWGYCR